MIKNPFRSLALPSLFFVLLSCEDKDDAQSDSSPESRSNGESNESRFNKLGQDLKSAISVEKIQTLLSVDSEIKTKILDHKSYGSVTFTWPSDRKEILKLGNSEVAKAVSNQVRINNPTQIKLYGLADVRAAFDRQYQEVTPEQMKEAAKAIQDQKAKMDREKGVVSGKVEKRVEKSVMSGIAGAALKQQYESVAGLGDAAKWEKSGRMLVILDGDQILSIGCDVSAESDECRDAAVKIAKAVYENL